MNSENTSDNSQAKALNKTDVIGSLNLSNLEILIYGKDEKLSVKIGNGYYNWKCSREELLIRLTNRILDIYDNEIRLKVKKIAKSQLPKSIGVKKSRSKKMHKWSESFLENGSYWKKCQHCGIYSISLMSVIHYAKDSKTILNTVRPNCL